MTKIPAVLILTIAISVAAQFAFRCSAGLMTSVDRQPSNERVLLIACGVGLP